MSIKTCKNVKREKKICPKNDSHNNDCPSVCSVQVRLHPKHENTENVYARAKKTVHEKHLAWIIESFPAVSQCPFLGGLKCCRREGNPAEEPSKPPSNVFDFEGPVRFCLSKSDDPVDKQHLGTRPRRWLNHTRSAILCATAARCHQESRLLKADKSCQKECLLLSPLAAEFCLPTWWQRSAFWVLCDSISHSENVFVCFACRESWNVRGAGPGEGAMIVCELDDGQKQLWCRKTELKMGFFYLFSSLFQ